MIPLRLDPVRVAVRDDAEGVLVYADGALAAVLVHLGPLHGPQQGWWFLEAGFGPLAVPDQPMFQTLEEAEAWIARRLEPPLIPPGA